MSGQAFQFQTSNRDKVSITFSCSNHAVRITEAMKNLQGLGAADTNEKLQAKFISEDKHLKFLFDHQSEEGDCLHQAVFFENTDYPIMIDGQGIVDNGTIHFYIAGHEETGLCYGKQMVYGAINFGNQVGLTEFKVTYSIDGKPKELAFQTEVLSYKMDYRTDLKAMIRDVEEEFSMLSYSFLKKTYLTFKEKQGKSTDLIWWQIFQQCHKEIISACNSIINSPKRRLKSTARFERAERMPFIPVELENEYAAFKHDDKHLYRTEEFYLSKDTVENRFLKYAMTDMLRNFLRIKEHIKESLKIENEGLISGELDEIEQRLKRINRNPFFHGIGSFHGFSQDSIIMKKAHGYSAIYRNWILLSCGYELEEGIRKLEVKDISDLYEIWCFIKVKNMVADIFKNSAVAYFDKGKAVSSDFIRKLVYGKKTELVMKQNGVEMASVMYNASSYKDERRHYSPIKDTRTLTTTQRPDIVLRLTKDKAGIKFTYLFDAKYRIDDKPDSKGYDVPPEDAINQMHRYRDAIYYDQAADGKLKKEIIGGYVLYPGNLEKDLVRNSYYYESIAKVGIGAFPLKPGSNSEIVLYEQIKSWIEDRENCLHNLLEASIPQKGLTYGAELPIDEQTYVLVGYYKLAQEDWIFNSAPMGQYNVRALGDLNRFLNVKYLLLHGQDSTMSDLLFEVSGNVRVVSQEQIRKMGYQTSYYEGSYFVYNFKKTKVIIEEGNRWNTNSLPNATSHGLPFLLTLSQLKSCILKDG